MSRTVADQVPTITLRGGQAIPQLGLGTFKIPPADTADIVTRALLAGYRHIDTAAAYGNEAGVGQAIHAAGLDRSEVFVTTKLWNGDHGRQAARNALQASLQRLEMSYVDLYLIHWPVPAADRYVETWQTLLELQSEGLIRTAGVSNFLPEHLDRLVDATGVAPAVNQIELHPYLQQAALRRHNDGLGIVTEAWSPLGQGQALRNPVVAELADVYGRTPGQIVLRWHVQLGNVVIPKTVTPARIAENADLFSFHLSAAEMLRLGDLETGERIGPDPARFNRGS